MSVIINGGAGVTFPDGVQQTNGVTNTGGDPNYYAARAWVNFNGTGTPAIRAGANVSSITPNGTGDYTINFTEAMPDANYAIVCTCDTGPDGGRTHVVIVSLTAGGARIRCNSSTTSGTGQNCATVTAVIFR